ncbi:unnamed protein product [Moneuplotes crassus]|uniref:Uncharacterized protein n=1 Tax=Euplotes crassus TaxID=5936 RepID=A0AAD1XTV9_EUPCR|nr:unnamed protein product [Moneuplotes crassus]
MATTKVSKEIHDLSPFIKQWLFQNDSFDSKSSIKDDKIDFKHQEYQNYLLSKQLEFKKYRLNIFYLNHYALKIQHTIFKLSILKKLKASKCPCCNKPRNPKKKVKRTGHRLDCICLKCSSLLMKNLFNLKSKMEKHPHSNRLNTTSYLNAFNCQKDISTTSGKLKCEEPKHLDVVEAYGHFNNIFKIPQKIVKSAFIYDSALPNTSKSLQNSSNTHNTSTEPFKTKGNGRDRKSMGYKKGVNSVERNISNSFVSPNKSKNFHSNFRSIGYEEQKSFGNRRDSGTYARSNKAVNSISAIINTREMTIKVSQNPGNSTVKKPQNHNKKPKGKKNPISSKFDNIISKKGHLSGYNHSQDYSFPVKSLNPRKLQNSKSSGKLNKKLISQRSNDQWKKSKGGSRVLSKNASVSKKRTKSSNRAKENEFKTVLRPTQMNNISSEMGNHTRKSEKFYLKPLKEEFTYEKDILKPLIAPHNHVILKENYSKTASKIPNRQHGSRQENLSPQSVILKENGLDKITCDIFKSHEGSSSHQSDESSRVNSSEKESMKLSLSQATKYLKKQKKCSKNSKMYMTHEGCRKVIRYNPKSRSEKTDLSQAELEVHTKTSDLPSSQRPIESKEIDLVHDMELFAQESLQKPINNESINDSKVCKNQEVSPNKMASKKTSPKKVLTSSPFELALENGKKPDEEAIKDFASSTNLLSMSNEIFDVLDSSNLVGELRSSLSSQTSQPDYDNMAMEAWEEVDKIKEEKPPKQVKLHNYTTPDSNWADDYNNGFPSKINTNDIDIIVEDFENEIDSDYSMTINSKNHRRILSDSIANAGSEGEVEILGCS